MKHGKANIIIFIRNTVILLTASLLVLAFINRRGVYPWGWDTYGHLFKGEILYESIKKGEFFLNYHGSWYNGIQPYRYWAPLPYYILAVINLFTSNIITTFSVFIVFTFILGGVGWLLWGIYTGRQNLGLILGLLWFFVPNNLRILFAEGNIPYVIVNSLVPYVFLYYYKSLQEDRVINYIKLASIMFIITLNHAMLAAMTGFSMFILALVDSVINKRYFKHLIILLYAFMGIMASSFWLYPALKGGIMSMDKASVANVMESLTYPLIQSLNPFGRLSYNQIYYFGLGFAFIAFFGLLFSAKKQGPLFLTAIIILLGTTKAALPVLEKLPLNQLFWMNRFTSISMAMIITGLVLWKHLRKSVLAALIGILVLDSAISFYVLGFNVQFPKDMAEILETASKIAVQRIGVMDTSNYGSFPSYYIGTNKGRLVTNQVFGWAWQGAATSQNLVELNTALEEGYYGFMFDRALELGADTLIVKKPLVNDLGSLDKYAFQIGYMKYRENDETIIYKYPVSSSFGTSVSYEGIVIGSYSPNMIYLFPKLQTGSSNYLDDYSFNELKSQRAIFLSGFKYRNKKYAENLLLDLSRNGVKIMIDATGLEGSFLGVTAEPILIINNYKEIYYKRDRLYMEDFPEEYSSFRTFFLNGIKNEDSYMVSDNRLINYIGKKDNDNLTFIGMNIPYYAFLTKDPNAVRILEEGLNLKAYDLPERKIHSVKIEKADNTINISGASEGIIVPIAALDAFKKVKGNYDIMDNLIRLKTPMLTVKIIYPYIGIGTALSILFIVLIILLSTFMKIKYERLRKEV